MKWFYIRMAIIFGVFIIPQIIAAIIFSVIRKRKYDWMMEMPQKEGETEQNFTIRKGRYNTVHEALIYGAYAFTVLVCLVPLFWDFRWWALLLWFLLVATVVLEAKSLIRTQRYWHIFVDETSIVEHKPSGKRTVHAWQDIRKVNYFIEKGKYHADSIWVYAGMDKLLIHADSYTPGYELLLKRLKRDGLIEADDGMSL